MFNYVIRRKKDGLIWDESWKNVECLEALIQCASKVEGLRNLTNMIRRAKFCEMDISFDDYEIIALKQVWKVVE